MLVLAGGAVALVVAGVVLLVVDGDTATAPSPTPVLSEPSLTPVLSEPKRLTGFEAAAIARNYLFDVGGGGISELSGEFIDIECEQRDFNDNRGAWIVTCDRIDGSGIVFDTLTFRVFDSTSEVQQVGR